MPKKRNQHKLRTKDRAHEVFQKVEMTGGTSQCWRWLGYCGPRPIFTMLRRRLQAQKLIYGLKHGIKYDDVPYLGMLCDNELCCNPHHMVPKAEKKLHQVMEE